MASKVADGLHKLVAGGLISISAAGIGAIGWGVYSLYVLRPAHLKAQADAKAVDAASESAPVAAATAPSYAEQTSSESR